MSESGFLPVQFGKYQLVEKLAEGGMAEIFKATSSGAQGFEKTVVIKRVLPTLLKDDTFVERFIREAKIMVRLNHPKVVQVLDFGEVDGQYYIAMEYVRGIDCQTLLRQCHLLCCRLHTGIAVHIVADVLDALDYAHTLCDETGKRLGVLHRDISPSNIFISDLGEVKLGDFGVAKVVGWQELTGPGAMRGKHGYMAPEMIMEVSVDHRADLFSTGVVLAELLMNTRLFLSDNPLETLLKVRDVNLERLDQHGQHIDPALRRILDYALTRDPELRYQDAASFRDALHNYLFDNGMMIRSVELREFFEFLKTAPQISGQEKTLFDGSQPYERVMVAPPLKRRDEAEKSAVPKRRTFLSPPPRSAPVPPIGIEARRVIPLVASDCLTPVSTTCALPNPDLSGSLPMCSLVKLLFHLAVEERTGLLVLRRGTVVKELHLDHGDPQHISSNLTQELVGQYLTQNGVISQQQLAQALQVMADHDGKLGRALVGLKLLRPIEVARHLTRQVQQKLLDAFCWEDGEYRFYNEQMIRQQGASLGLDAFALIREGVSAIPQPLLTARLQPVMASRFRPADTPPVPLELFRLSDASRQLVRLLDGRSTLSALWQRLSNESERQLFAQLVYLLVETEMMVA